MKNNILIFLFFSFLGFSNLSFGQCADEISINSASAQCNGDGTSTVTINVTVIFGNGNNSAVISYDLGDGPIDAIILEDDNGDIINQTYMFDVPSCNDFSISLTAWTNPSGGGSSCSTPTPVTENIIVNPPLPVEFGNVEVGFSTKGNVLKWVTFSEINNHRFEIERSTDGNQFNRIGVLKASRNSITEKEYTFIDTNPVQGINYYRIKQIDLDENFSYSIIVQKSFVQNLDLSIFPNPSSEYITITSEVNTFYIYDSSGKIVKRINKFKLCENVKISDLKAGIYFIQNFEHKVQSKLIILN